MAAQTCVRAKHATLSTTVADTVEFSGRGQSLRITNRHATEPLYFTPGTLDASGNPVTAVAEADDSFFVKAGESLTVRAWGYGGGTRNLKISLVGNSNPYSVEIW